MRPKLSKLDVLKYEADDWFELLYDHGPEISIISAPTQLLFIGKLQIALTGIYSMIDDGQSLIRKDGHTPHVFDITPAATCELTK